MTYVLIFIGLLLMFVLWSFIEHRRILVSSYIIESGSQIKDNGALSFVVLADLHNKAYSKDNQKLLKKIYKEKPDFVIIAGDMITKRKAAYPGKGYNLIKELSDHYPVYYAYGNHEQSFEDLSHIDEASPSNTDLSLYESWKTYKEELLQLGVHLLDNKSIILYHNDRMITITGLSISRNFYYKGKANKLGLDDIHNLVGSRSREGYQILIAHNPLYFKEYVKWGADLTLSGHVHGGLIRIPFLGGLISPQIQVFPKYDGGQYSENNQHMILSRGLGSHSFMPRFLNPPELVFIKLK